MVAVAETRIDLNLLSIIPSIASSNQYVWDVYDVSVVRDSDFILFSPIYWSPSLEHRYIYQGNICICENQFH